MGRPYLPKALQRFNMNFKFLPSEMLTCKFHSGKKKRLCSWSRCDRWWSPGVQKMIFFTDETIIWALCPIFVSNIVQLTVNRLLCVIHALRKKIKQGHWKSIYNNSRVWCAAGSLISIPERKPSILTLSSAKSKWFTGGRKSYFRGKNESQEKGDEYATFFKVREDTVEYQHFKKA